MLGGALFSTAVVFALLSLVAPIRAAALRLSAIISLSALALFSNHWTTYFASIFIIATAVTELEFLHILAAIVRGDKNYFDFRREFLTREEALQKSRQDAEVERPELPVKPEVSALDGEAKPLRIPNRASFSRGRTTALAFQIEERAVAWFERKKGVPVQRYVRFRGDAGTVEVDGFVQARRGGRDTLLEIKWIRDSHALLLRHRLEQFAEIPRGYKTITNRDPELVLVLVTPALTTIPESVLEKVRQRLTAAGVQYTIMIAPYAELGVTVEPDADSSIESPTPEGSTPS